METFLYGKHFVVKGLSRQNTSQVNGRHHRQPGGTGESDNPLPPVVVLFLLFSVDRRGE
jgi:hypothetical protein